ncbi:hypothetical protein SteCoe_14160 [Stentor coeruleus]|uniref:Uncharacterized protein n=1 Tax=Stentor coeruleus TaxID=5963 RepID=A0A1R2C6Q2_9CILI|nr:hypothetical protein SteCoe_14160 [Stentor coeruleus]
MIPRRQIGSFNSYYPWPIQDISKRGCTAPRPEKQENLFIPSRVPTSSSKYTDSKIPNTKVSIKPSGFKSYKPREPIRTISSYSSEAASYKDQRPTTNAYLPLSPTPEDIEHVWEEGNKRPKTQNEKCRRKIISPKAKEPNSEPFPVRGGNNGGRTLFDVPIIVIKDDKNRRIASARRNIGSRAGQRPSTFKPARSTFASSLDQEFLELFQM